MTVWLNHFKTAVLNFMELLCPHILKRDTRYRLAVLAIVCVTVTLFKLV
jgi:hypothetical protein